VGTLQQRSTNADRSKAGLLLGCCLPSNKSDHQVGLLLNRNMVGFCWAVRCCCWLALWLSFGLGNFSGTISAFFFCEDGWKCHCQKRRHVGGPGQGGEKKGQSSATFLEFRAWPLRGSCDHTYVTLLLASQRDGRMARRALNSAGLL